MFQSTHFNKRKNLRIISIKVNNILVRKKSSRLSERIFRIIDKTPPNVSKYFVIILLIFLSREFLKGFYLDPLLFLNTWIFTDYFLYNIFPYILMYNVFNNTSIKLNYCIKLSDEFG